MITHTKQIHNYKHDIDTTTFLRKFEISPYLFENLTYKECNIILHANMDNINSFMHLYSVI